MARDAARDGECRPALRRAAARRHRHTDSDNVSPRLGVAWDVRGNGRSVLRTALGRYYAPIPLRALANALQRNGSTYRIIQLGPNAPGAPAFPNVLPSIPAGVLSNIITIDPDIESSRSDQFSLQYEQQVGLNGSASVAYEHLRGTGIIVGPNINVPTTTDPTVPNLGRPNPNHANNQQYQSIGDSWYDGATLALSQRPVSWGSLRLSYTYSKEKTRPANPSSSSRRRTTSTRSADVPQRSALTASCSAAR
jgi:hypothetical protein